MLSQGFYIGVLIILALLILVTFFRVLKGPRLTDRIVGINMIGTFTILIICVLSISLKEGYLLDIAIIYAMISFLAVVVLTKIYLGVYLERMERRKKNLAEKEIAAESGTGGKRDA